MYGGFAIASPPIAGYIGKLRCRPLICNFTVTCIESIGTQYGQKYISTDINNQY